MLLFCEPKLSEKFITDTFSVVIYFSPSFVKSDYRKIIAQLSQNFHPT